MNSYGETHVQPNLNGRVPFVQPRHLPRETSPSRANAVNDRTLAFCLLPFLREWLHRQGAQIDAVSNDELLDRVRNTFVNMPAPTR